MKTSTYLMAALLVGAAAWNSTAVAEQSAESSSAWEEAKSAFTPVNELRENSLQSSSTESAETTMRVIGVDGSSDLTVFPPVTGGTSKPTVLPAAEPQVVGMTFQPGAAAAQSQTDSQIERRSELLLLPAVESSIPASTNLTSNESGDRLSYATRAFSPEEPQAPQVASTEQFLQNAVPTQWSPGVVPSGCCDSGCDSCCDGCCQSCCRPCIVVVGTEFVFVSPDVNGESVSFRYDDTTSGDFFTVGPAAGDASIDDFYAAPRIWLGVQGPCWGLVARYYHFWAWENAHDLFIPPDITPGDLGFDVSNMLEAYYTDIEVTRNFCLHGCKNQFAFGVRHGALEHVESIYGVLDAAGGVLEGSARRYRESHGTGLLLGLNGRKPLFCNSCAHWFYNARGSILWGPSTYEVQTLATAEAGDGVAETVEGAIAAVDEDLFIAELQVGLQWDFALRCLPAKAFFRTAFEYQYWDAGGGLAAAGSFAGFGDPATEEVNVFADAPGLIVDFVGLSIGTGFTW